MNRFLIRFLLFCVVLSGAGLMLYRHIGPTAAGLAFDSQRRAAPYYLVHLVRSLPGSDRADGALRERLILAAAADDGQVIWRTEVTERHEARTAHGSTWGQLAAVDTIRLPRGGALVQMVTGADFRALWADPAREPVIAGASVAPAPLRPGGTVVLILFECVDPTVAAPLGSPGTDGWLRALPGYGGEVSWVTELAWIRGSQAWNRLVMLQFPDASAAAAWLDDPVTLAERAIAARQLGDLLVLVASGTS